MEININLEQEKALANLEANLGHAFANRQLLHIALRHRSYVNQIRESTEGAEWLEDNQRLEFLGDAVLSLSISTILYEHFPVQKEGVLSKMRAGLVNESRLAEIARHIGVPAALFLGRGEETSEGREKNSILADALEALLAGVYLDRGFEAASNVVKRLWSDLILRSSRDDLLKDFKTRLQEQTQQRFNLTPDYRLTATHGPDHSRIFEISLYLSNRCLAAGRGRSKKEAEQAAAKTVLDLIKAPDFSRT
jgi:ribonuclease III